MASEPWRVPECRDSPGDSGRRSPRHLPTARSSCPTPATPRPWPGNWAIPGTPGLQHRIGGLEKARRNRQHQLRPGEPRAYDDDDSRREGREHRQRHPGCVDLGEASGRCADPRLGLDPRTDHRCRVETAEAGQATSAVASCATSIHSRRISAIAAARRSKPC